MNEGIKKTIEAERVESLRQILSIKKGIDMTYDEASAAAYGLISLFEAFLE